MTILSNIKLMRKQNIWKTAIFALILVIMLQSTGFAISNYLQYRSELIRILQEYIPGLQKIKSGDLSAADPILENVLDQIEHNVHKNEGYFPVIRENVENYLHIIQNYDIVKSTLQKFQQGINYMEAEQFVEAYNHYSALFNQGKEENPLSGFPNLHIPLEEDLDDFIPRITDKEIKDLQRLISVSPQNRIKVFLMPFNNQTGDHNLDYLRMALVESINILLKRYDIFAPFTLSSFNLEIGERDEQSIQQIMQSQGIEILVLGEYTKQENLIQVQASVKDITNNNLFLNFNISGQTDFRLFDVIDSIGDRLAFNIETYNPETFTETSVLVGTESSMLSPFSEQGYLQYLEKQIKTVQEKASIYYVNKASSDINEMEPIEAIIHTELLMNILTDDLNLSAVEIAAYAGPQYVALLHSTEENILLFADINYEELNQLIDEEEYREGLQQIDSAKDDVQELLSTQIIGPVVTNVCQDILVELERYQETNDTFLTEYWEQFNLGAHFRIGFYPFFFGEFDRLSDTQYYPTLELAFLFRIPLSNYHMLIPVGLSFGYYNTTLKQDYLAAEGMLETHWIPISVYGAFLYEIYWDLWLGLGLYGNMDLIYSDSTNEEINQAIDNPILKASIGISLEFSYQILEGLYISFCPIYNIQFGNQQPLMFFTPKFGITYYFY